MNKIDLLYRNYKVNRIMLVFRLMNKSRFFIVCFYICVCINAVHAQRKTASYRLCDFHQHTTFTDGDFSIKHVFSACDSIGLAWWANSEHGGESKRNGVESGLDLMAETSWKPEQIKGDKLSPVRMWRWQTILDYSFPYIVASRGNYNSPIQIQGLEWNVPGHEHASVCILDEQYSVSPSALPIAEFEYRFDNSDKDKTGGNEYGWEKSKKEGHLKALEALEWLQQHYSHTSWVIPAHPDRKSRWTIADFRDFNTIAPDVCFGFEGIPGHQAASDRGEYAPRNNTYGMYTYGGTGLMCAKIGGLWDALLSEGRRWWIFSSSDFHNLKSDFYPGEYNKNYVYMPNYISPMDLANYLRSGNSFVVSGNFIDDLSFEINGVSMGGTCFTGKDEVLLTIKVHQPDGVRLPLHHIDLIEGQVGKIKNPKDSEYTTDSVATTKVIACFDQLKKDSNNYYTIVYKVKMSSPYTYYRLRGTHLAPNTLNETDSLGNPLADKGVNSRDKALNDQWFYSNPIFVKQVQNATEVVVHRGANHLAPENTIPSAMKALEHGATWIELDVRTSKDGVLYNLHDETLNRTTDGSGAIREMLSHEVEKLDAGSWFGKEFKGVKIPRIEEMLDYLKLKDAKVFFDVKDCDLKTLIKLVREKGFEKKSFFWFGNPLMLQEFVRLAPDLMVKVNASNIGDIKRWMKVCTPSVVEVSTENITPAFRYFCQSHGIKIMAADFDSENNYKEVIYKEADMVNLDQPELFEKVLEKMK